MDKTSKEDLAAEDINEFLNSKINLSAIKEFCKQEIVKLLESIPGSKAMFWDETLMDPITLIADAQIFKSREVKEFYKLVPNKEPNCSSINVIFLVKADESLMPLVSEYIKLISHADERKVFFIYFVPSVSFRCRKLLEINGVIGLFQKIESLSIFFFPLDDDIISFEDHNNFKDIFLDNDHSSLCYIADALLWIQTIYGIIPTILSKGNISAKLSALIRRKQQELLKTTKLPPVTSQIQNLFIVDRLVDLYTPLINQLTYEGLIDENFSINSGYAMLPIELTSNNTSSSTNEKKKSNETFSIEDLKPSLQKIYLNSSNKIFNEIRSMNFSAVGAYLSQKTKSLTSEVEVVKSSSSLKQIKELVSKIPSIQTKKMSLALHTSIAALLKNITDDEVFRSIISTEQEFYHNIDTDKLNAQIEKMICQKKPLESVIRLLCLQSLVNNGLKSKLLDSYRTAILQTYGYEKVIGLMKLEKLNMLCLQSDSLNYKFLMKSLRLVSNYCNETNPSDIHYVHSGYAPLSVRLVQAITDFVLYQSRTSLESIKLVNGQFIEQKQHVPASLLQKSVHTTLPITLVLFIGGCTMSEIAALRFLNQSDSRITEYIIATTTIINGRKLVNQIFDLK